MVPALVVRRAWYHWHNNCLPEQQGGRPASSSAVWKRLQKLYAKSAGRLIKEDE